MRIDPAPGAAHCRPRLAALLLLVGWAWLCPRAPAEEREDDQGGSPKRTDGAARAGEEIYRRTCARCHGPSGEGVKGKRSSPLEGDLSVAQLARFIAESMPEDDPGACAGEEAEMVARYIHDAFYSPIARARNRPARIEPSRLTVSQHRNAVADLVASFRAPVGLGEERGLSARYFNGRRPGGQAVLERIDPEIRFDFGRSSPAPEQLDPQGFSALWEGSVIATDTGEHEIVVRTDHAARLWLNGREKPLIDAWVKSGAETEHRASLFLLGGRAYPIKLEFTSRKQGVDDKKKAEATPIPASVELCWRLPGRPLEAIPARCLSPHRAPEVFVLDAPFPPDDRSEGYERGTSASQEWEEAATAAAVAAAGHIAERLDELAQVRGGDGDADREPKVRELCRRLVERAFRRPLAEEERRLYVDRQLEGAADPRAAVKRVALLALLSPRFLHLDLAAGAPDAHAVASRLSFALWDSIPDQDLLDAAAAGRLATREGVAAQAERMAGDPRTRFKVRRFLHQWLKVEDVPDLAKDPARFPSFDAALASDLRTSLDLLLEDAVWGERSDFRRLLTAEELFVNGRVGRYYGFDLPPDAPFRKVPAREPERAGVLSHPYLMARFAYAASSSPIHRGVFVVRSVLGRGLRPPPEAVAALAPDLHPDLTTRERVSLQTGPEACQSCHSVINPLGFTLERFDADGRYRDEERRRPIDASGSLLLPSGEIRRFAGARELAELLAASEEVQRAFAVQLFHHMVKQPVLAYGAETPARLREAFAAGGFSVRRLLVEIAATAARKGLDAPGTAGHNEPPRDKGRRIRV
ncbi:MAG: DUF1592 domain-containing protein [Planctomycetes bacterium]|nr:DUF1592 domain-containing protein [Planctomycetota bacterium]